jgi:hypothetical protein
MNELPRQKQSEKESYVFFGILVAVIGLGALAVLLKLAGLF